MSGALLMRIVLGEALSGCRVEKRPEGIRQDLGAIWAMNSVIQMRDVRPGSGRYEWR